MRRKQTGPELKALELDTLKYITPDNVRDSIHYIGIFPERMSPADVTFARKSGLLETSSDTLRLSKIALHYILEAISYREYAFLILSKQWIKTTNVKDKPTVYNEPLLPFVLEEIQIRGRINKSTFAQEIDQALITKYAPVVLSNSESMRYIRGLLIASELVAVDESDYIINPLATALVHDLIKNRNKIVPPTEESDFEVYWNTMEHGVFDIITPQSKNVYSSFYPNLIK
ncbi:MAG: hypothetical protein NDJ65_00520 [Paludibacteraceae bacterium]|nr:hypothetical protein [Paludibacteraceae bacterium]